MAGIKQQKGKQDDVAEYLIKAGVDPDKARRRPETLPLVRLRRESPFDWNGSDYRPDLFRYSMVFSDRQQRELERKGFFRLDEKAVDVRQNGINDGRIMARPMDLELKAREARAEIDFLRRTAKNVNTRGVLDQETGASYDITTNYSPATAVEV